MKLEILVKDIELTDELYDYIQKKIDSFENILGNDNNNASCVFKIAYNTKSHNNDVKTFIAEANIRSERKSWNVKAKGSTMEESIDEVKDEMLKKIRRTNNKKESLIKKGGRKIKELIRFNRK